MNSLSFADKIHAKKILVAPLNWGLGHAARCIPLIKALKKNNQVVIASDGESLALLQMEFPTLTCLPLPAYDISYSGNSSFIWGMMKQTPKITLAISKEMAETEDIVKQHHIDMVISDHRLGCYSDLCHSVIMAHQIQIKGKIGITGMLGSKLNKFFINRFDECWIPDYKPRNMSLAGELSEAQGLKNYRYIGPLSRLKDKPSTTKKYEALVILSGPEPARTRTEDLLIRALAPLQKRIAIVSGKTSKEKRIGVELDHYALSDTQQLNELINQSKVVISRSGYTTIMDMEVMRKNAVLIPTPGQTEQEYLMQHLSGRGHLQFLDEKNISTSSLAEALALFSDSTI